MTDSSPNVVLALLVIASVAALTAAAIGQPCEPVWVQQLPTFIPSPRIWHASAWFGDDVTPMTVVYGGYPGSPQGLTDTWGWDGCNWRELHRGDVDGAHPGPRYTHQMVYDSGRNVVFLFGDYYSDTHGYPPHDTWAGRLTDGGTRLEWSQVHPGGDPGVDCPAGREACAMVYDSYHQRVVLYGGFTGDAPPGNSDTWVWEWNGPDSGTWTRFGPDPAPPGRRRAHAMAFDSTRRRIVLFGGLTNDPNQQLATWELDVTDPTTAAWCKVHDGSDPSSPPARYFHSMTYDEARGVTVLFGGIPIAPDLPPLSDTWAWDGCQWTEITTIDTPAARQGAPLAYDSARQVVVVFGGGSNSDPPFHSDTSEFTACEGQPPNADAGADESVNEGEFVTLDGSDSSAQAGAPLTYSWAQVAGPPVELNAADSPHPTFEAPPVSIGGATLTFQLIVRQCEVASEADTVDITIKNINHEPEALAGDDQAVAEGASVKLDARNSYDPDNDEITFSWERIAGTPDVTLVGADTAEPTFTAPWVGHLGETFTFRLTVSDGELSDTDTVNVLVEDINHDPNAVAGPDQTRDEGLLVTLDGSDSSDPDGDPLAYLWEQIGEPTVALSDPTTPTPTFTAPSVVGVTSITLTFRVTVDDGWGGTDSDEVVITVLDTNAPPACDLAQPSLGMLWPPNHKLIPISIIGVTDPEDDDVTITITGVTQDEPLNGLGDGDTAPDAVIQGDTVLLRAERAGGGNGRVYVISFAADDGIGGVCDGQVTVYVPHDRKQGTACVDDGQLHDSTGS